MKITEEEQQRKGGYHSQQAVQCFRYYVYNRIGFPMINSSMPNKSYFTVTLMFLQNFYGTIINQTDGNFKHIDWW